MNNPKSMSRILLLGNFLFILSLSIFSSCNKDEEEPCTNGSFTVTIDGILWTGATFNNSMIKGEDAGTETKRMDIRVAATDGSSIILTFTDLTTGVTGNCVSSTATYTPFANIATGLENVFFFSLMDVDGNPDVAYDGTLTITSCDEEKKMVSGTFTFTGFTSGTKGINGVFTNMCYKL